MLPVTTRQVRHLTTELRVNKGMPLFENVGSTGNEVRRPGACLFVCVCVFRVQGGVGIRMPDQRPVSRSGHQA